MPRQSIEPERYGVALDKTEFIDQMVETFTNTYRTWTIDELLLHPREAVHFCDDVRRRFSYYDLPDDIVLRAILQRRKNP